MAPTASSLLLLSLLPALFASAAGANGAFNITTILQTFPALSGFNDLLTQTKVAQEINRRSSVTILAPDGSAVGAISSLAPEVQKHVVAVHVLLDYYDSEKLNSLNVKSTSITTLYQTSGTADQRQGYVNMSVVNRTIKFGSSMPGSPQDSELSKIVYSKPYNLSVFQISKAIIPPGIEKSTGDVRSSPPSPPPTQPAKAPAPASKTTPPSANAPEAETPTAAEAPEASTPPAADAPADAPAADTPADGPAADSPADAPAADSPAADAPSAESDADADEGKSDAARVAVGAWVGAVTLAALMLGMRAN